MFQNAQRPILVLLLMTAQESKRRITKILLLPLCNLVVKFYYAEPHKEDTELQKGAVIIGLDYF